MGENGKKKSWREIFNIKEGEGKKLKLIPDFQHTPEPPVIKEVASREFPELDMDEVNMMQEVATRMHRGLRDEMEKVILSKLKEHGIDFNYEEEASRRFKRMVVEKSPNGEETWYYDDGSVSGLRVVTFAIEQEGLKDMGMKIKLEYKYY